MHDVLLLPASHTVQEAGIQPAAPREAWPLPKLVRVLESMQQTGGWVHCGSRRPPLPLQPSQRLARDLSAPTYCVPTHAAVDRQLLWREVWLGASGAADWLRRQRSFASSTAAMSMVSAAAACPLLRVCLGLEGVFGVTICLVK